MSKEKDYKYLLHAFRIPEEAGLINLDEGDILQLNCGGAVYLYESLLASTKEEAAAMAKIAAEQMAPAPGSTILTFVLCITGDIDLDLDAVEQITNQMVELFPENGTGCFGTRFCEGQKGIRFILATSEGQADTVEEFYT